jgi:hypothetical protein
MTSRDIFVSMSPRVDLVSVSSQVDFVSRSLQVDHAGALYAKEDLSVLPGERRYRGEARPGVSGIASSVITNVPKPFRKSFSWDYFRQIHPASAQ